MKNASESLFCFVFLCYYGQWLKVVYCRHFNTFPHFLLYCLCLTVNYFVSILVVVWLAAEFLSVCKSILFPCFTIDVWSADCCGYTA